MAERLWRPDEEPGEPIRPQMLFVPEKLDGLAFLPPPIENRFGMGTKQGRFSDDSIAWRYNHQYGIASIPRHHGIIVADVGLEEEIPGTTLNEEQFRNLQNTATKLSEAIKQGRMGALKYWSRRADRWLRKHPLSS